MFTNVYTAERNANAQYVAELTKAQHKQVVRRAHAGRRQQEQALRTTGSTTRWHMRVMTMVKGVWARTSSISSTSAR